MWGHLTSAVAVATILAGCAGAVAPPSAMRSVSPPSPPPSRTPTPTIVLSPPPTHEPIGPLPVDCEPGPEPVPVSDHVGNGVGGDPAWAVGFGPAATLSYGPSDPYDDDGWKRKVLWLLRRSAAESVTVTGLRVDDRSPLLFDYLESGLHETALILDPAAPHGEHGDWFEYRGYVVVPSAGCYELTATWPGGGWNLPFRAGLDPTQG